MIIRLIAFLLLSLSIDNLNAQWSNLQGGANDVVSTFYSDSTNLLYVAGRFTQIGNNNINQIAVWDGINWSSFGNNEPCSSTHHIKCITKFNNQIIIGGRFDSIGNSLVNNIAKWNGINWESLGMGFDDNVFALVVYNGELYAGGAFNYSGSDTVRALAKWNGISWDTVGHFVGSIYSMIEYNNNLIIAGSFYRQANPGANIISFDGVSWDTSISKLNNTVLKVRNINDTLYACGDFTAGPVNLSNYISSYYSNNWHPMPYPSGGANTVTDIIEFHGKKYICGYFTNPPDIGILNGNTYDYFFNANGFIAALHVFNDKLFIAGQFFQTISGQNYYCIISYDDLLNETGKIMDDISDNFRIYPNPSSDGKIKISLSKQQTVLFEFFNLKGQLIYRTLSDHSFELNLEKGYYQLKVTDVNKKMVSKKIIIL